MATDGRATNDAARTDSYRFSARFSTAINSRRVMVDGTDRLNVSGPMGEHVGYRDLTTGRDHAESQLFEAVVASVADAWVPDEGRLEAAEPMTSGLEPPPALSSVASTTWTDLSVNRPAAALREALPSKTGPELSSWLAGIEGEDRVGEILAEVTRAWPIWQSIHSVPVGRGAADIDHVVMGPGGVFTLNAKHHRDASIYVNRNGFLVNGSSTHHVRNARHEADRAARLLSRAVGIQLHVTGLIVPVRARNVRVKEQPEGLFIIPLEDLHHWLRGTGQILPVNVLARVWEAARRSTTWRT